MGKFIFNNTSLVFITESIIPVIDVGMEWIKLFSEFTSFLKLMLAAWEENKCNPNIGGGSICAAEQMILLSFPVCNCSFRCTIHRKSHSSTTAKGCKGQS
jgi:hypothetical protein